LQAIDPQQFPILKKQVIPPVPRLFLVLFFPVPAGKPDWK
jgi:hypothetical protein